MVNQNMGTIYFFMGLTVDWETLLVLSEQRLLF